MITTKFMLNALALFIFSLTLTSIAAAQRAQTYVKPGGDDGDQCTRAQPCRTIGGALDKTNPGGEIILLETGAYEPATINQPVTIAAAPGVLAEIAPVSGDAITINIADVNQPDMVVLRNLHLRNSESAQHGITFNSGSALHVENCVIADFVGGYGINFNPAHGMLVVRNTTMRNNSIGIYVRGNSGVAKASIINSHVADNYHGVYANANSRVAISETTAAGNTNGFVASSDTSGAMAFMVIVNSVATNNDWGVRSFGTNVSQTDVSNSTITFNGIGLQRTGNTGIFTRGNNTLRGNTTNGSFSGSFTAQ